MSSLGATSTQILLRTLQPPEAANRLVTLLLDLVRASSQQAAWRNTRQAKPTPSNHHHPLLVRKREPYPQRSSSSEDFRNSLLEYHIPATGCTQVQNTPTSLTTHTQPNLKNSHYGPFSLTTISFRRSWQFIRDEIDLIVQRLSDILILPLEREDTAKPQKGEKPAVLPKQSKNKVPHFPHPNPE